jgi:hypothetical protein
MNPRALMLPAVPLLLAGLGWWGSGSLVAKLVKPQAAPVVGQINLPPGIEALAPAGPRPPLGYLELAAFGFTEPPKKVVIKPKVLVASDFYVVDSILKGNNLNSATIDNKTVKAGDKLDKKYTVVSVAADGVWVKAPGKRSKPEKIGFRPYVASVEETSGKVNTAANLAPGAQPAPAPANVAPPGLRDFRQILETLKL